jgi:hypothetical protein
LSTQQLAQSGRAATAIPNYTKRVFSKKLGRHVGECTFNQQFWVGGAAASTVASLRTVYVMGVVVSDDALTGPYILNGVEPSSVTYFFPNENVPVEPMWEVLSEMRSAHRPLEDRACEEMSEFDRNYPW